MAEWTPRIRQALQRIVDILLGGRILRQVKQEGAQSAAGVERWLVVDSGKAGKQAGGVVIPWVLGSGSWVLSWVSILHRGAD
ncbi:hypothetical protein F4777DRAFT_578243 [Nemania sp. FL0916]|nr:hypothetical protein F4777DRAFT_578243 [Nemania sp. FL0916]